MIDDIVIVYCLNILRDYIEPRWAVFTGYKTWGTRILVGIDLDYNFKLPNMTFRNIL